MIWIGDSPLRQFGGRPRARATPFPREDRLRNVKMKAARLTL